MKEVQKNFLQIAKMRLSFIFLFFSVFAFAQIDGDPTKGKELFNANCASCHQLDSKLVGPALGGVTERLERDWLQKWIKNNEELRASGDAYANKIFEEYNQTQMNLFPSLSEGDIDNILSYTERPDEAKDVKAETEESTDVAASGSKGSSAGASTTVVVLGFGVLATLLAWILFKLSQLNKLTSQEIERKRRMVEGENLGLFEEVQVEKSKGLALLFDKYGAFVKPILPLFILIAMFGVWKSVLGVGVDKGYMPEQPIYFSHKIHAGEQSIDCQLCHSSAKYGKVSGIPSVNVCMNCHMLVDEYKGEYIEEGKSKEFYDGEIQKLYGYAGWNPETRTYDHSKSKPIEWVRIHNMPDFVYFNHSQHVVAGEATIKQAKGIAVEDPVCFACHSEVDEMNEVYMANDFTMGWCLECHRTTEVDMGNEYNKEYYNELHAKLKAEHGDDVKVTVDAIGGMECGKCHY